MSRSFFIALLVLASLHNSVAKRDAPSSFPSFASFLSSRGRTYAEGSANYEQRRVLYEKRIAVAEKHNSQLHRRWTAGLSDLWDRTEAELAALRGYHGRAISAPDQAVQSGVRSSALQPSLYLKQAQKAEPLPQSITWKRLKALDTHIDQGGCGSCWAVASALVLQAHSEIYYPKSSRTFSMQELVSCVPNPRQCGGTGGCEGATVELALDYVMKNGLASESDVPYQGADRRCTVQPVNASVGTSLRQRRGIEQAGSNLDQSGGRAFGMGGWEKLPENKYEPLKRALVEYGPVGVSLAADSWMSYSSGIFDGCEKDSIINHAVTLIGYGEETGSGAKWWQIKNSWGPDWGEGGNIRLMRRDDEESYCGTDHKPQDGSGCLGGPKEVTVCGTCGILYDTAVPHFTGDGSKAKMQSLLAY